MTKLKVAILEDNKELLKDLKLQLEDTNLVEVVAFSTTSKEFLEKIKNGSPEALILDIDLGRDNLSGIDIANKIKLPVLFVSGKTRDFIQNIEDLNLNLEIIVEHLTKPITLDKLNKILPKFISEIRLKENVKYVYLDFANSKRNKIAIGSIVYLESDVASGKPELNNKQIFFTNRNPEILNDFSFTKMEEKGLSEKQFIIIHKSYRVNIDQILCYKKDTHQIEVRCQNSSCNVQSKYLNVSENYRKYIRL